MFHAGKTIEQMVSIFPNRTSTQIRSKLHRMGLKKKKKDPRIPDISSPTDVKKQKGK